MASRTPGSLVAGMDDYIPKPNEVPRLRECLERIQTARSLTRLKSESGTGRGRRTLGTRHTGNLDLANRHRRAGQSHKQWLTKVPLRASRLILRQLPQSLTPFDRRDVHYQLTILREETS